MKINYVLVDLENVQPKNLDLLNGAPFKILVFVGANQAKIPFELVKAVQKFGQEAQYIQIEGNGPNALDFHIAYYIGKLAAEEKDAFFHIVSKDGGFDPLIKHLHTQKIHCKRSASVNDIPLVKIVSASSTERSSAIIDNLTKQKSARPRTLKTLSSSIKSWFVNQVTDQEVQLIIEQLAAKGIVVINESKVSYVLPQP